MSKNDLRGLVYSMFGNQSRFAREIGWTVQKTSLIIRLKQEPKLIELQKMSTVLGRPIEEIAAYYTAAKGESA